MGASQGGAVQGYAETQFIQPVRNHAAFNSHEVFLLDFTVFRHQLSCNTAILRQYEQALRFNIQPAGGGQATQMVRVKRMGLFVRPVKIFGPDKRGREAVSVLSLM